MNEATHENDNILSMEEFPIKALKHSKKTRKSAIPSNV
jgi:hypothetical protein